LRGVLGGCLEDGGDGGGYLVDFVGGEIGVHN
jgi:hypothetical protein